MDQLAEWLRQQLKDDENAANAAAQRAHSAEWDASNRPLTGSSGVDRAFLHAAGQTLARIPGELESDDMSVVNHIALHDPAAVLADIAAKRAVLDRYTQARAAVNAVQGLDMPGPVEELNHYEIVVRDLASGYRYRPGWRANWE